MLLYVLATLDAVFVSHAHVIERQHAQPSAAVEWSAVAWREWFVHRRFGLDPWFFFGPGDAGVTRCPTNVRLSLGATTSTGVRLDLIDDSHRPVTVRASCTVAYAALRLRATHGRLPDGRTLWRLRARRSGAEK